MARGGKVMGVAAGLLAVPVLITGVFAIMIFGSDSPAKEKDECGLTGSAAVGVIESDTSGEQVSNAQAIDQVAQAAGLSGQATLVALVAAVGESDLMSLDHGHLDSLGLFQQRPSQGWGTVEQIMDPTYSATSFFLGPKHDGVGGLVSVKGWETMPLTAAIHAVQRNFDPGYYTPFEGRARDFAAKAGIDLTRAASGATSSPMAGPCGPATTLTLSDGPCPIDHAGTGGVDCNKAISFVTEQMNSGSRGWYRLCLGLVSTAYGSMYAGIPTAYAGALMLQSSGHMQPPTTNYAAIPRGALVWYDGRSTGNAAGHVALSLGNGYAISNDVPVADGRVGIVPISYFESTWGQRFMGWSAPAL